MDLRFERIGLAILKWAGRLTALLLLGMVAMIAIGQGVPNVLEQEWRVQAMLAAMAVMLIGLVLGWRWEVVGGMTVFAALIALNAVEWTANHRLLGGAFPWFAIPAGLYLLHAALARRLAASSPAGG